jgi:TPR repeat protein
MIGFFSNKDKKQDLERATSERAKAIVKNTSHEDTMIDNAQYGNDIIGQANTAYAAKDYDTAVKLFLKMKEPAGMFNAASVLFYQKKYYESFKYMKKAADAGVWESFGGLAKFYREGWGVEIDYKKSSYWTLKAAEAGDTVCMALAGASYLNGIFGFEKDTNLALEWLGSAIFSGDSAAENILRNAGFEVEFDENNQMSFNRI